MALSARHYARLGAVQYLYAWKAQNDSIHSPDDQFLIDSGVLKQADLVYFQKLLNAIPRKISEIDSILTQAMDRGIDVVDPVELAILRLGTYELIAEPDVPPEVVTDECIELSREFGNPDSYKFINGTLDKIAFGDGALLKSRPDKKKQSISGQEFTLIEKYFSNRASNGAGVVTGIGDDCAVVDIPAGKQLLLSTDTLLVNIHFRSNTIPEDVGYKALAVSLSDLAAMGATPAYATLNLSIPEYDSQWLEQFSAGFFEVASMFGVSLIGGDTVRGPLAISVTVYGLANKGESTLRSGARDGDGIFVTGTLGDAALGYLHSRLNLDLQLADSEYLEQRLNRPTPRVNAGMALQTLASAAIDISDGLLADLSHLLKASGVGATIELQTIPISPVYRKVLNDVGWDLALTYGDDYELCFTIPQESEIDFGELAIKAGVPVKRIGTVLEQLGLVVVNASGEEYHAKQLGYSHF